MKKKVLFVVVSFVSLSFCAFLFSSSEAEANTSSYNPCPNGCYAGEYSCYCYTWNYDEKDAKSGGDTEIRDILE